MQLIEVFGMNPFEFIQERVSFEIATDPSLYSNDDVWFSSRNMPTRHLSISSESLLGLITMPPSLSKELSICFLVRPVILLDISATSPT